MLFVKHQEAGRRKSTASGSESAWICSVICYPHILLSTELQILCFFVAGCAGSD